jgi:putative ABC transport system permease protein
MEDGAYILSLRYACHAGPPSPQQRKLETASSWRLPYPMETKEAFRIALQSLWANKLRSVLTLLGVVIAVASVIAVVTLVNGANVYIATKINRQGADVFTISQQPAFTTSYKDYLKYQKRKIVSLEQYRRCSSSVRHALRWGVPELDRRDSSTAGAVQHGHADSRLHRADAGDAESEHCGGAKPTQADEDHAAHVATDWSGH